MPILRSSKHELFAQALAKGMSAASAYEEAGYARHDGNAGRLSRNEQVRARVLELQGASAERAGVTIQRIVDDLATIAFNECAKDSDRISAHGLLGKHLGMFRDKVEHSGPGGGPIETREHSPLDRAKALAAVLAASQSG